MEYSTINSNRSQMIKAYLYAINLILLFSMYIDISYITSLQGINYAHYILTPLDYRIHYVSWFNIIYALAFPIGLFMAVLLAIKFQHNLYISYRLLTLVSLIFICYYSIYLLFPISEISLLGKPLLTPAANFNDTITNLLYQTTAPWNSFPSMHVTMGLVYLYVIFAWYPNNKILKALFLIWFLGMCAGTVTTRYHSFVDGIVGGIFFLALFYLSKRMTPFMMQIAEACSHKKIITILIGIAMILLTLQLIFYQKAVAVTTGFQV